MKKIAFLFTVLLFMSIPNQSQWLQTTGPDGTDVYSFYADENNIWLGTSTGVYLSTNNGNWWVKRSTGLSANVNPINSILVNNGYVFVAQYSYGLFYSSDMGMSWFSCNNGIENYSNIYSLQKINNVLLCGGNYQGIYLSSNNGNNWIMTNGGPNYTRTMFCYNNNVLAGGNNGVYKSTDNGFNWNFSGNGIGNNTVYGIAMIGSNIFASTTYNIYMSTDGGLNWVSRSSWYSTIYCLTSLGPNLYIGTYFYGIEKSTDFGISWTPVNSGIYATTAYAIITSGNNIFSGFYNKGGVFFTSDQGNSWEAKNSNLPNLQINDICVNGNSIYTATSYVGVHVTSNDGDNWNILYPALPATITFNAVAAFGNYAFAGNNNFIYKSSNNGINWSPVFSGSCYSIAVNNNLVFAGMYNAILRSSDFGTTWFAFSSPSVYSFSFSGNTVFAGTSNGQVLCSSDNGVTWNIILNGNFGTIRGLACYNYSLFAGTSNNGVLRTTDMGITWVLCNSGLGSLNISHLIMYQQNVFVASDNIYVSTNYGANWTIVSYGMYGANPTRLAIKIPYIFIGTNGLSVWRRPLAEIVGIKQTSREVPNEFYLHQNYPNPFNPITKIKFSIPNGIVVQTFLSVYDILGREVATLVNEKLSPGTYEIEWDASNFPSGVYFYKLTAGDFTQTKKMLLIK